MEKQYPVKVELIPSSGGVFEVIVDGKLIYSKKATGVFPDELTIMGMLGED
ncbi:MAG: Rdx family protein [Desulfuromusa sp.]|nr:Rdx family protein [Desulfuromusa sp.]